MVLWRNGPQKFRPKHRPWSFFWGIGPRFFRQTISGELFGANWSQVFSPKQNSGHHIGAEAGALCPGRRSHRRSEAGSPREMPVGQARDAEMSWSPKKKFASKGLFPLGNPRTAQFPLVIPQFRSKLMDQVPCHSYV